MRIVIVGGGKIGYYTTKTLLERGHEVRLLETDKGVCEKIANELDAWVLCADGTSVEALAAAGTSKADVFIALTGKDEDNLVACEIAKEHFHAKKTIARTNNPKNLEVMRRLGVDISVSSTEIITELIEREITDNEGKRLLATLNRGQASIVELVVPEGWAYRDRPLMELELPRNCIIIAVTRGDKMELPRGDTKLLPKDHITAVVLSENRRQFEKIFEK